MNILQKISCSFAILLLTTASVFGVDLRLPLEVKGEVDDFIVLKADTNGKTVKWFVLDKGLRMFPNDLLKDSKTSIVIGSKPGRYRVLAFTALADEPSDIAICTVVIGEPGPDPGPNPPPPPPPPPTPTDPFVKTLQAVLDRETAIDKLDKAKLLSALYKEAAVTMIYKADLKTVAEFKRLMSDAAKEMIGDSIQTVRRAIGDELNKTLPTDPKAELTTATRDIIARQLNRMAKCLEAMK